MASTIGLGNWRGHCTWSLAPRERLSLWPCLLCPGEPQLDDGTLNPPAHSLHRHLPCSRKKILAYRSKCPNEKCLSGLLQAAGLKERVSYGGLKADDSRRHCRKGNADPEALMGGAAISLLRFTIAALAIQERKRYRQGASQHELVV